MHSRCRSWWTRDRCRLFLVGCLLSVVSSGDVMAIACSTSVKCGSTLEAALETIAKLGIPKVDLLTIGKWAHVNVVDFANDVDGTIARTDELMKRHGLTPVAMNTGTSVQLHDRGDAASAQRRREVGAF